MSDQRRQRLQEILRRGGFASLGELSSRLSVSESTIRRDLEALETDGSIRRTHGGAFWIGGSDTMAIFRDRRDDHWPAKVAIGQAAAAMVHDHETVLLDGGSTTYEVARALVSRRLQVVTNSLPVAQVLSSGPQIDLVMIGGLVRGHTAVVIGPATLSQLQDIRVTTAFLSIAGAGEDGFYNADMMLVESERAMMASADRSIVVADSSKFGRTSLSRICGLCDVDGVVSDTGLSTAWIEALGDGGVEVVSAKPTVNLATSPTPIPLSDTAGSTSSPH